jgi:hypothetical protein
VSDVLWPLSDTTARLASIVGTEIGSFNVPVGG